MKLYLHFPERQAYSIFKDLTGFASAAFIACKLTVFKARNIAIKAAVNEKGNIKVVTRIIFTDRKIIY